jgi:hypothetical protein
MNIEYWAPLLRAWRRMKALLLQPFEPRKWLVLAFCAWVASLLDGTGGAPGGGGRSPAAGHRAPADLGDAAEVLRGGWARVGEAWHSILGNWGATLVVFVGIPLVVALLLALVWLTSRFKMITLDNLVRGRAEVVEPWRRLAPLGDSLFLFRVGFGIAVLAAGAALVLLLVTFGVLSFTTQARGLSVVGLVTGGLLTLLFGVGVAYAWLFLSSFVVPIMYRDNVSAVAAWRAFLPWLSAEPVSFLLYGPFVLLLFIAAGLAIAALGLATCCVGFFILALPLVGMVLLLPLIVAYRYLSLEFLAQFDPGLDVFAPPRGGAPGVEPA